MSEPMSHVEIEDVLSSIRRLVSEDLRPGRSGRAAGKADLAPVAPSAPSAPVSQALPDAPRDSKLLLTPALRVVAAQPAAAPPPLVAEVRPAAVPEPRTPLPRLHLGIESRRDLDEGMFATVSPAPEAEFESEIGDPYPEVTRKEWTEDGWVLADAGPAPEAPIDPWAGEEHAGLPEDDGFAAEPAAPAAEAPRAAEPHGPAAAQATAALADDPEQEALEVVFDEQILRELVRDILREELQGRMGERMTRNIRKLVHAEIARLVAAQDLD